MNAVDHNLSRDDLADLEQYCVEIDESIRQANKHRDFARTRFTEIIKRKLYRAEASSVEEFVDRRWKKSRSWLYNQLELERVQDSLPPELSTGVDTVEKAREVAKIPPKRRMGVIADIQKNGHPITPKTIRDAALAHAPTPTLKKQEPIDVEPIIRDATGYEIPKHRVEFFEKSVTSGREILTRVSSLRGALKRAQDNKDAQYAFVSISTTMSLLNNLYGELSALVPHAVCPYCQGQTSDHCMTCRKTGFLPKHQWDHAVPSDLKAVREKANRKK